MRLHVISSRIGAAALVLGLTQFTVAGDLSPQLGKKDKVLMEETFAGSEVPKGFTVNTGKLTIADGALQASELAQDDHAGAFRYRLPVQDCAIQVDFRFEGANMFHLGFDPAPGELKKKGHLFSVIVTPGTWNITEHTDKSNPESKNKILATGPLKLEKGKWYTLLLECKGDDVMAQIDGVKSLRATSKDFHVKKPGLVFRMGGKDDQKVLFDNVKVWALK